MTDRGKPRFRLFGHTADVGLHVFGRNLEELFEGAAVALMSLVTDQKKIKPAGKRKIRLEADSPEALLRAWMAEILYLYQAENWLFARAGFTTLQDNALEAEVMGETRDPSRHEITGEVKAVTWHRLGIRRGRKGELKATVILDV